MVGIMMPRIPGCEATHSISSTARSMSWVMGTRAIPPRRCGECEHISARNRLWACAPAKASSGSAMAPANRPAPNGGEAMPVTASASANSTSAATPSASSSLSRTDGSKAPFRPSSLSVSQPMM